MAQNIDLLGAQYPSVPSVLLPKVGGGTASFTDVTDTTATAADVAEGKTFHLASGAAAVGTASIPEPSSTTPKMDGTAAVGTATTYARADHVHPTDTSRQATLVSGTNIKTINNESLLGSGNITISGGSGGGGMLVTFTTPDYGTTYVADKTFGEIFDAFDSGIQPVLKFIPAYGDTTYTTIKTAYVSNGSKPYRIISTSFYTTVLSGAANDYPSWESGGGGNN